MEIIIDDKFTHNIHWPFRKSLTYMLTPLSDSNIDIIKIISNIVTKASIKITIGTK